MKMNDQLRQVCVLIGLVCKYYLRMKILQQMFAVTDQKYANKFKQQKNQRYVSTTWHSQVIGTYKGVWVGQNFLLTFLVLKHIKNTAIVLSNAPLCLATFSLLLE